LTALAILSLGLVYFEKSERINSIENHRCSLCEFVAWFIFGLSSLWVLAILVAATIK
jgi:hypothetical protein